MLISNEIAIKSQLLREARDHSGDTNEKISLGSPALLLLDTLITEGSRNYLPVLLPAIRVLYSMTTVDSLIEKSSGDRKRPQEKEPFDEYTVWIACTIISSLIADNAECKSIAMSICVNGGVCKLQPINPFNKFSEKFSFSVPARHPRTSSTREVTWFRS